MLCGAAAAWPLAARAQQPAVPVIGYLRNTSASDSTSFVAAMNDGLKEEGFVDGQNVTIDYRWTDNQQDRLPALAADLVRRQAAVIVTGGNEASLAAKAATTTIPIVFATGNDPVEIGLVASVNRPDANLTGASFISKAIVGKRLELLHLLVPNATVIAFLANPNGAPIAEVEVEQRQVLAAAQSNGVQLLLLAASSEHDIDAAFERLVEQHVGGLLLGSSTFYIARRDQIIALAARYAIPTSYFQPEFTAAGGLMSYGADERDAFRQAGVYAGRILKGAKPADLPVMLPVRFPLVINLKTAKALGIEIPPRLLVLADEVIE